MSEKNFGWGGDTGVKFGRMMKCVWGYQYAQWHVFESVCLCERFE